MTKRTSKSVSETPKASSRSGTSNRTEGTAKKPNKRKKKAKPQGKFAIVAKKAREMKPKEVLESLIAAGIVKQEGGLSEEYTRGDN